MTENEFEAYQNNNFSSERLLGVYLPSIIPLMSEGAFAWNRVDKLLKKRMDNLILEKKIFNEGIEFSIFEILIMYQMTILEHQRNGHIDLIKGFTIAEILPHCSETEKRYIGMQKFLLDLFGELTKRLDWKGKLIIKDTLFNVFTNFDLKYLNFVGEAAVLNMLLKANYKLLAIEERQPNTKPIDFIFYKPLTNRYFNIEVVNIHFDSERLGTESDIEQFLKYRVINKIKSKILNIKLPAHFFLIPVLWGDIAGMRKIQALFNKTPMVLGNRVLEPCVFITKRSPTEIFNFFGRISTIDLEDIN